MKVITLLAVLGLAMSGCDNNAGRSSAFTNKPPIKDLTSSQLHDLAMTCQSYAGNRSARAPYDEEYCDSAIRSWINVPLQVARIPAPVLMTESPKK